MKKFSKLGLFLLMCAMGGNIVSALPTDFSYADTLSNIGTALEISKVPTKGTIRTPITIPNGVASDASAVTVTVYTPRNKVLAVSDFDAIGADTRTFTPTLVGTYRVVYSANNDSDLKVATVSEEYSIAVTSAVYTLKFADNSEQIIPTITNKEHNIVLPMPDVLDEDGKVIPEGSRSPVDVKVTDPQYNILTEAIVGEEADTTKIHENEEGLKYFIPTLTGQYTVTYTYQDNNATSVSKTYTVDVRNTYEPDDINLGYQFNSTMPTSATLGTEVTLPSVSGIDKDNSNATVSVYTNIEIQYIDTTSGTTQYVSTGYAIGEANRTDMYTFTPKSAGSYRIKYTVTDFFGHVSGPNYYYINNVTDDQSPADLQIVMPYTVTEGAVDEDALVTATNRVPTKFDVTYTNAGTSVPGLVAFPAVYATDNVSEYDGLTFTVTLVDSDSNTTYLYTYQAGTGEVNEDAAANTYVYYNFATGGADTYTLKYTVRDEKGYSTSQSYTLTVVDDLGDLPEPKITSPSIPASVTPGQTVQILKPTAVDYDGNNTVSSSNVIDRALVVNSTYTIYYIDDSSNVVELQAATAIEEDEDATSYLSFVVPENIYSAVPVGKDIIISFNFTTTDNHDQTATVAKTSEVINTEITNMPVFTTDEATVGTYFDGSFDQFTTVSIPDIVFSDAYDSQLSVGIIVKDQNGNAVSSVATVEYSEVAGVYYATISDASFYATKNGIYTITFVANNTGSNSLVQSFSLDVDDKEIPVITVTNIPSTVELGNTVTLPKAVVYDGGSELLDAETWISVVAENITSNPSGTTLKLSGYNFTPLAEGTFRVKYYAKDAADNYAITREFVITVEDSVSPSVVIGGGEYTSANGSLPNMPLVVSGTTYAAVSVPSFTASDSYGINWAKTSVKVTNSSGTKMTLTETDDGYTFIPTGDGTYTVVYTATDNSNNVTTVTKTLIVGDTVSPEITIGDTDANLPENMGVGDSLVLNLAEDVVYANDNKDGEYDITSTNFNVALTGPDSTTVSPVITSSGHTYTFALEDAGTYTITYTATDEAGNVETQTHTFEVTAEETSSVISTTVWGTVLIIVSVLVLAGVVIYFVKTGKKGKVAKK